MDIFSSLFALLVTVNENLSKHNKLFASENNGVSQKKLAHEDLNLRLNCHFDHT